MFSYCLYWVFNYLSLNWMCKCVPLSLSVFVFIRAGMDGVWGLCGRGFSVGTVHCDAKLLPRLDVWCSSIICICVWFLCNIQVYEPYLIIKKTLGQSLEWFCLFSCVAAVFCTTSLQMSQTLDIVKCTGFYCFAGFCFHRSFIKVIFHRAVFPLVVHVLVLLKMWVAWLCTHLGQHRGFVSVERCDEYLLIPDQRYI